VRKASVQKKLNTDKGTVEERLRLADQILQRVKSLVLVADSEGKITYVSPSVEEITGYRPEEFLGEGWWKLSRADPAEAEQERESLRRAARGEIPLSEAPYERPIQTRSGETRWIVWQDALGPDQTVIGVGHDITERKRVVEVVRDSEERYRSLFENMLDGYAYCKMLFEHGQPRDFVYIDVNPAFETLTGLKDVVGKKVSQVIPGIQESNPELFVIYGRVALTGKPERFETYLPALGIWFSISVFSPKAEHFVAVFDNITERKRAEEALRDSEKRFRALVEYSSDEVSLITADGRLLYESPSATPTLGYKPNQFLGQDIFQLVHPDDLERVRSQFARLAQEPGRHLRDQFRLRHSSGEWRWVEAVGTNLLAEPAVQAIVINYHDITERKLAETKLRESEANLAAAQRITHLGSWELDLQDLENLNFNTLRWSEEVFRIFGYEPGEIEVTNDNFFRAVHPDDRAKVTAAVASYLNGGEPYSIDHRIIRPDGTERIVHEQSEILYRDGRPLKMVGTVQDVTESRLAEQARREAEAQYRSLVEQLPMIVYINSNKDIAETTYVSPQIQTILGYTPEEWLADPKSWQNALHPDDRQFVLEKVESINRSGKPFNMEFRMTARDGRVVWFRDQAVLIRDSRGQPLYWQGLMIDITESKQRERELEAIAALSSGLREIRSTDEILLHLLSEALTSANAKHGGIWLYDPDRDEISLAYEIGQSVKLPNVMKRGEGIIGLAVESGDVVISDDLQKDPRVIEQLRELAPAGLSAVCLPLRSADNLVGAMLITNESPREFTSNDIRILTALAQIGGSAIHRTTLYEQTVNQLGRLAALRTIDMAITSSLDLNLTLNVVLDQVIKQLSMDAADILLLKPDLQMLEFASGKGFKTQSIETGSLRLGEGPPGRAALERKTLFLGDLAQAALPLKRRKLLDDEKFVSYYAAPLIAKGKVKGVLEVFHRSALTHDRQLVQFLEALSDQAAIAIDNSALFHDLQRSNIDLALAYDATIEGWSRALDLRDKETEGHTQRVTEVALKLARAVGVSDEQLVHIRRGALLHDIGKMGVPDSILLKPDKLTDEEWELMRKHPGYAYEMLMPIAHLRPALDIPYCHHEKWDGTGYPRGLSGEQIPLSARIFAVVDVWDALRSDRPYRAGWENEKVLNYLREQSGKHFDPRVVEIFMQQVMSSE
jgi:PAS domain S-box-containing protein/putative nucleotidyltransferase with HDIG domain